MDSGASLTACDIVNNYEERELARLFYRYGEEPRSRSIARAIVAYRQTHGSVRGTQELAAIIRNNAYGGEKVIKTLSRVFQALRIEVNGELDVLGRAIDGGINCLDGHGRMAVISYHSLEDRIVKQAFAEKAKSDWGPKGVGLRGASGLWRNCHGDQKAFDCNSERDRVELKGQKCEIASY
jgi:16S rRNA (cytosine1402-N4)-methyltransferase